MNKLEKFGKIYLNVNQSCIIVVTGTRAPYHNSRYTLRRKKEPSCFQYQMGGCLEQNWYRTTCLRKDMKISFLNYIVKSFFEIHFAFTTYQMIWIICNSNPRYCDMYSSHLWFCIASLLKTEITLSSFHMKYFKINQSRAQISYHQITLCVIFIFHHFEPPTSGGTNV